MTTVQIVAGIALVVAVVIFVAVMAMERVIARRIAAYERAIDARLHEDYAARDGMFERNPRVLRGGKN